MTTLTEPDIARWFNSPPLTLAALRGRVVAIHCFQMLCPGCVGRSLPQMQQLHAMRMADLAVIGLHTVFEHHEAMTPVALGAFLSEYRIAFPVGVDRPGEDGPLPATMRAWGLQGTPT
nr:TlpA disulfide reductase family protein [Paracoccus sp. (in: a-proteobacteria)]